MEALDITSNGLQSKGFHFYRDGHTVVLENGDGSQVRSSIYAKDWNKTIRQFEKKLEKSQMVTDKLVYQEILACLSKNYGKITEKENSVGATNNKDTIQTETPLEKLDDMSLEEWQRQLLVRYQELQDVIKKSAMPLYNLWIKTELHKKQEQEAAAN